MDQLRFERLARAFAAAAPLSPAERAPGLAALCADDPDLGARLVQMLADHDAQTLDTLLAAGAQLRQDLQGGAAGTSEAPLPAAIGRFEVLGEIARGGIGRVLRANDPSIGRQVAVKVLRPEFEQQPLARQLLAEEGRLGGRLQHPSIVPVYEIGTAADDRPYLAMKVVEGRDFGAMLAARADPRDDQTRMLGVFEHICQAMAYAHRCGVVHRDLKPNNVMVGAFGEVQVMDWGIALQLHSDGAPGDAPTPPRISGTPSYMAPEQARGELACIDRRSDVFGLGAILCEILTGAPPYGTGTTAELLGRAQRGELEHDHARLRAVGVAAGDLVDLALACLHADPAARPADAAAVATAVTRHIESAAARLHQAELGARSAAARAASERKVRRLTMALALVVVTVVIGGAWTWTTALQRAQQRTQTAERRATAALLAAERRFAVADAPPADDLAAWSAAARAARGVLDQLDADSPPDIAARAHELQQQAQSLADDLEFCRALALAGADTTNTNRFDRRPMRQALRACFAARRGAPIEAGDAQAVASSLATIRWRDLLVTALDAWLRIELECDLASPVARRVHAVVDLLDEDPWRQRLRTANKDRDLAALRLLAVDPAAEFEPASALRHLALALLWSSDVTAATAVLYRCIARFPGDFPALLDLGWMLLQSRTAEAGELMRYVQAALALRPNDPAALELSALALNYAGRPVDALAVIEAVVAQHPDSTRLHTRGQLRQRTGDLKGAAADFEAVLGHLDRSHHAWPLLALQAAVVHIEMGALDTAWAHYHAAVTSANARGELLVSIADSLGSLAVESLARRHTADPQDAWAAWLMLGISLRSRSAGAALQAFERVDAAPRWAMQLAANVGAELRARLGFAVASFGTAQQAIDRLSTGTDDADRARLATMLSGLRAAGQDAIASHLEGLWCERVGRLEEALSHYRAAIAADRNAIEAWQRLHACRSAVDDVEAADAELADLLAAGRPGPILRLPLRAPRLRALAPGLGDFALQWAMPPVLDERSRPFAAHLRVCDEASVEPRHAVFDMWLRPESTGFAAPAGLLAADRSYRAQLRVLGRNGEAGPWAPAVAVTAAAGCEALALDLSRWANADTVVDPGDPDNDAFDPKNGFSLLVDSFDGERLGVRTANGLPRDGRLGLFTLGPYDRPQTIQLSLSRREPLRLELPSGRYAGIHLLGAATNGRATVPIMIGYEHGEPREVAADLAFADWFDQGSPRALAFEREQGLEHLGMPILAGMDRIGPDGFEERNEARLFDYFVPMDPGREARCLVFVLNRASGHEPQTVVNVVAVTLMRPAAPTTGR